MIFFSEYNRCINCNLICVECKKNIYCNYCNKFFKSYQSLLYFINRYHLEINIYDKKNFWIIYKKSFNKIYEEKLLYK